MGRAGEGFWRIAELRGFVSRLVFIQIVIAEFADAASPSPTLPAKGEGATLISRVPYLRQSSLFQSESAEQERLRVPASLVTCADTNVWRALPRRGGLSRLRGA